MGHRVAEVGSLSASAKMALKNRQARICYFREKCVVFARNFMMEKRQVTHGGPQLTSMMENVTSLTCLDNLITEKFDPCPHFCSSMPGFFSPPEG